MRVYINPVRVASYGAMSYFPKNLDMAFYICELIMANNGCGHIETRNSEGFWKMSHKFEPNYGIVTIDAMKP